MSILYRNYIKRFLDLVLTILLMVILSPVLCLVGVIVYAAMGRPILFVQRRRGFKGCPFMIRKFRTMKIIVKTENRIVPDEQRLTRLGSVLRRWSLDELPELMNVLRGKMSLVGPRPLLMEYLDRYTPEQARRHEIRPGITGWAQVNGRNAVSWEEKFKFDVWYVDHVSFGLDMKILWKTLIQVLKREGISAKGHATMPAFVGSGEKKGSD